MDKVRPDAYALLNEAQKTLFDKLSKSFDVEIVEEDGGYAITPVVRKLWQPGNDGQPNEVKGVYVGMRECHSDKSDETWEVPSVRESGSDEVLMLPAHALVLNFFADIPVGVKVMVRYLGESGKVNKYGNKTKLYQFKVWA